MKLIIISDNGCHHRKFKLSGWTAITLFLICSGIIVTYFSVSKHLKKEIISKNEIQLLNKFDSLLVKTAKLEAQVKRLNSLGKDIAIKNNTDIGAYLLSQAPAMGGIGINAIGDNSYSSSIITQASIAKSIDDLELELELEEQRYAAISMAQSSLQSIYKNQITKSKSSVSSY